MLVCYDQWQQPASEDIGRLLADATVCFGWFHAWDEVWGFDQGAITQSVLGTAGRVVQMHDLAAAPYAALL